MVLSPRAVTIHPVAQVREVWLCFRGRAVARWDDGRTFFGCPDARDELRPSSLPALKNLLQQLRKSSPSAKRATRSIAHNRSAGSGPAFARLSPTSTLQWIQALFIRGFCPQRWRARHSSAPHGDSRWPSRHLRDPRAIEQRDFDRNGYFPGSELQAAPPLVYLVAPALRFRSSTAFSLSRTGKHTSRLGGKLAPRPRCCDALIMGL